MLTAGLILAIQALTAVATPTSAARSLTIRIPGTQAVHRVPVISRPDGQLSVRADLLANALGGSVERLPGGHFSLSISGAIMELTDQSGFATTPTGPIPLPVPAWVDGRQLYLPLAFVADVLPRVANGLIYDAERSEVRLFTPLLPNASRHHAGRIVTLAPSDDVRPAFHRAVATLPPIASDPPVSADDDTVGVSPTGDVLLGDRDRDEPSAAASVGTPPARHRLVVVDAGHGGPDHGMIGPIGSTHQLYEKNVALAVALKVGTALRRRGIDVLETRTTDTLIALSDRGRIANEHHGDLFLSIHVNAANPRWHDPAGARGFETYFLAEAKTEDDRRVEQMENEAVRFETGANAPAHDPLDFVIHDMAQNEHLRESSELAEIIQRRLGEIEPGPDRGVKQAGFVVLVTAYMPAVLVEIGFGTNAAEARYLDNPTDQNRIASAIAAATSEYLARYERRVKPVGQ